MPPTRPKVPEPVEWARRVNNRWIAHHGLKESARIYLDHLEASDPERLVRSCESARQMVRVCGPGEDPKPWFYAGLFSLVARAEAVQFLQDHWFTASCIPSLPPAFGQSIQPEHVGPETKAKLSRIREVLVASRREGQ